MRRFIFYCSAVIFGFVPQAADVLCAFTGWNDIITAYVAFLCSGMILVKIRRDNGKITQHDC